MNELDSTRKGVNFNTFLRNNWLLILLFLYLVSPIDVIPEALFPLLGSADDAVVALVGLMKLWQESNRSH